MANQIPATVKQERRQRAMAAQREVAQTLSKSFLGREIRVLAEKHASARDIPPIDLSSWEHGLIRTEASQELSLKGRVTVARGEADAPDIDGRVYVTGRAPIGAFARVKVVGHTDYDLIAKVV
jgi:ribosomal protein S12 methylthiotransferase